MLLGSSGPVALGARGTARAAARRLARALKHVVLTVSSPRYRSARRQRRRDLRAFAAQVERVLGALPPMPAVRQALVVSGGGPAIETEVGLIKALALAGYRVAVIGRSDPILAAYYRLAGVSTFLHWDELVVPVGRSEAYGQLARASSSADVLRIRDGGTQVGRYAASTALRALRLGSIDLRVEPVRRRYEDRLRYSVASARAAERIVGSVRPDLVVFNDRGYSPQAELFERAIRAGADVITWNAAHRNNVLMLKRYHEGNRDDHPASLSEATWRHIRGIEWNAERRRAALGEIAACYRSGEWYSEVGTQAGTRVLDPGSVRAALGLREGVPCAAIFPHILWDGTFFWGEDIFESYEEWLVRTVEVACDNDRVDWLVKIHPANVTKNARDSVRGEAAEVLAIRERIRWLPPHVRTIPADSEISTFSLYGVIDHCLTVRGTVGIEAAAHGIRTATAGTGRFDRRGFTRDFGSVDAYRSYLAGIDGSDRMTALERELAERYAFGLFLLRPLRLVSMELEYQRDARASVRAGFRDVSRWDRSPDVEAFCSWVLDGKAEDYLADPGSISAPQM
jgi:hypothetical protein